MTLDDIQQVLEIDRMSFSLPWSEHSYRFELLQNTASRCRVAMVGDVIVGMIVIWIVEDEAHIATVAVHPDYRRLGIGKALLTTVLSEAIQRGAVAATLEVREHNEAAIALYHRFGFKVVSRRKRYYQDTHEDALIMTADSFGKDYLAWLSSNLTKTSIP
jgi:ribosomal-protein-alanine N-acetyltransferase